MVLIYMLIYRTQCPQLQSLHGWTAKGEQWPHGFLQSQPRGFHVDADQSAASDQPFGKAPELASSTTSANRFFFFCASFHSWHCSKAAAQSFYTSCHFNGKHSCNSWLVLTQSNTLWSGCLVSVQHYWRIQSFTFEHLMGVTQKCIVIAINKPTKTVRK